MDMGTSVTLSTPSPLALGAALWGMGTLGLMGALHCAGMCGGLAYRSCQPGPAAGFFYHVCRLLGYIVLGTLAASVSAPLIRARAAEPAVVVGVVVTVTLLWTAISELTGWEFTRFLGKTPLHSLSRFLAQRAHGASPVAKSALFGFATALLPCGLLYAALLQAAATGSAVYGAIAMTVFALATAPGLWGGSRLTQVIHKMFPNRAKLISVIISVLVAGVVGWRAFVPKKQPMACHDTESTSK